MTARVTPMTVEHAPAVLAIYQDGVDTGDATFATEAPDWATFDAECHRRQRLRRRYGSR